MCVAIKLAVKFYSSKEDARKILPDLTSGAYRPHLLIIGAPERTYLGVQFIACDESVGFDIEVQAIVKLPYSGVDYTALQPGVRFMIKEGRNTVGEGYVIAARH